MADRRYLHPLDRSQVKALPLLVAAVIARYGLFVPKARHDALLAADVDPAVDFRRLARSFLAAEGLRPRSEAAIRSLAKLSSRRKSICRSTRSAPRTTGTTGKFRAKRRIPGWPSPSVTAASAPASLLSSS